MSDVLIIGNGITGGTLACALAQKGLEVSIVDQQDPHRHLPSDGRSFALSHSSYRLFSTLGIWQDLTELTPIKTIHTSDGVLPQWVDYTEEDVKEGPLGYVVESSLLKSTVLKHVLSHKNITLHAPTSVTRLERTPSHTCVETNQGTILKAPLCIASDGRFSTIRDWANIPLIKWNYDQTAIVCNIAHTLPHNNRAFEHFLPSGPLAFVPRSGNTSGLVWSIEKDKAACLLSLSPEDFTQEVQALFGPSLGELTLISNRWSYPLSLCLPKRFIDTRLALLGDAAHTLHPIAGQGLNVGLRDVTTLADLILEAASLGLDLGSTYVLERYQKKRRMDVFSMAFLTDGLVRVFSTQSRLMARVRSLGFGAVKHITPLRNFMVRHAAGASESGSPLFLN